MDWIKANPEAIIAAIALVWGFLLFGWKREKYSFLILNLNAKVIKQVDNLLLVSIIVHLENKGQTRITARRRKDVDKEKNDPLYKEDADQCKHAGTLKIRSVPDKSQIELFDWYSLQQIADTSILKDPESKKGDLEQINYLNEFEDPEARYIDVDFWLEPNETYDLQIMVWLQPGTYAMKAYFLGEHVEYREEEYWSATRLFDFKVNKEKR